MLDILCTPGFSTRPESDLGAGRGVGMAVVCRAVNQLGGTLSLQTQADKGSRFTIRLPLTLAIIDALIVGAGGHTFAVPLLSLREIIEVAPAALRRMRGGGGQIVKYRDTALPVLRLAQAFGLPEGHKKGLLYALVCGRGALLQGLVVEALRGQREVVVMPLQDPLVQVRGVTGVTDLGDGRPVLTLDPQRVGESTAGLSRS